MAKHLLEKVSISIPQSSSMSTQSLITDAHFVACGKVVYSDYVEQPRCVTKKKMSQVFSTFQERLLVFCL